MRILTFSRKSSKTAGQEALRRAVRATRRITPDEVLSGPGRERILDAVRHGTESSVDLFPSLFAARRSLLVAGALPLILAAGMLVLLNREPPVAPGVGRTSLEVSKQDGQVYFRIANGSTAHVVSRSTVPDRFERSSSVTVTDGSFTDPLDDQAALVFYRID